jgi:hypothetical protein
LDDFSGFDFALMSFKISCSRSWDISGYVDAWGYAFPEGALEQVYFREGVKAICMATMALTILINSWALLNIIICSDDNRLRLLGGVLCYARATEGLAWIISIRAIIA